MPSNFTQNYQLSQWVKSDKVQMEDFNADNAKIDAAIKAETDARTALAGQVAKCGNCKIWTSSYIGTGVAGPEHPNTFTFPQKPLLAVIAPAGGSRIAWLTGQNGFLVYDKSNQVTWSGNTVSWFYDFSDKSPEHQLNFEGGRYLIIALLAADQ